MSKRALSRRDFIKSVAAVPGITLAASFLQACAPVAPTQTTAAQPAATAAPAIAAAAATSAPVAAAAAKSASSLRVVIPGTVPTLDYHWTTTTPTMTVGWHMFETLLAPDKNRVPQPQLADKVTPSSDGLTYDFELRKGIKFHNGKVMTSADVIASLNRWGKVAGIGKTMFAAVDGIDATGDYGLKIRMKRPYASLLSALAHWGQAAVIMPKEVIEAAGADQVKEFIGTGPYKFVEWKQDQYIKLTRYDGYQPRSEPASFIAGKREALIQDLYFVGGLDNAARVSGIEAGDYGFVMLVSPDNYARLQKNTALRFSVV
jgi:peptide/nickel transport system substrate-binding protein